MDSSPTQEPHRGSTPSPVNASRELYISTPKAKKGLDTPAMDTPAIPWIKERVSWLSRKKVCWFVGHPSHLFQFSNYKKFSMQHKCRHLARVSLSLEYPLQAWKIWQLGGSLSNTMMLAPGYSVIPPVIVTIIILDLKGSYFGADLMSPASPSTLSSPSWLRKLTILWLRTVSVFYAPA